MATTSSEGRVAARRRAVVDDAVRHAVDVMAEGGVGALTVSEVARRMGVRPPSLYKYFASLHALYDELFRRGVAANDAAVAQAVDGLPPGPDRLRAGVRAVVRWCVETPALAQLLYWRPVPGFEPSAATFEASVQQGSGVRQELATAVAAGHLHVDADSEDAVRLLTVLISGLISQQMANEPGAPFETGRFTRLTDQVVDLYLTRYAP